MGWGEGGVLPPAGQEKAGVTGQRGRGNPDVLGRLAGFAKVGAKSQDSLTPAGLGPHVSAGLTHRGVHSSLWSSGQGLAWWQRGKPRPTPGPMVAPPRCLPPIPCGQLSGQSRLTRVLIPSNGFRIPSAEQLSRPFSGLSPRPRPASLAASAPWLGDAISSCGPGRWSALISSARSLSFQSRWRSG